MINNNKLVYLKVPPLASTSRPSCGLAEHVPLPVANLMPSLAKLPTWMMENAEKKKKTMMNSMESACLSASLVSRFSIQRSHKCTCWTHECDNGHSNAVPCDRNKNKINGCCWYTLHCGRAKIGAIENLSPSWISDVRVVTFKYSND